MRQLFELCGRDREVRFSPFVWMVRMALHHKGLEFDSVPLTFLEKEPFADSGSKTLPVLRDGDTWVGDSLAIARYLERAYPEKPLFGSEVALAEAGFVQGLIIYASLVPLFPLIAGDVCAALDADNQAYFRKTREPRVGAETLEAAAEGRDEKRAAYQKGLAAFRGPLETQPFLSGASPAWSDYVLFGAFIWARCASDFDPLLGDETMSAWRERMLDLFGGEARSAKRANS